MRSRRFRDCRPGNSAHSRRDVGQEYGSAEPIRRPTVSAIVTKQSDKELGDRARQPRVRIARRKERGPGAVRRRAPPCTPGSLMHRDTSLVARGRELSGLAPDRSTTRGWLPRERRTGGDATGRTAAVCTGTRTQRPAQHLILHTRMDLASRHGRLRRRKKSRNVYHEHGDSCESSRAKAYVLAHAASLRATTQCRQYLRLCIR